MFDKFLALRAAAGGAGGASSWNDLKDKPFYEETITVCGDTLTWDGNMEGLITATDKTIVRISDITPPKEALTNGALLVKSDETYYDIEFSDNGDYMSGGGRWSPLIIVYAPAGQFPEPGLYVGRTQKTTGEVVWTSSVTIPGYTGFVSEQTVIKPIDTKYLPEHLHFGEGTEVVTFEFESDEELLAGAKVFAVGDTVTVEVDGVEHSLVAFDEDGCATIGDTFDDVGSGSGSYGWQLYVGDHGVEAYFTNFGKHTVSLDVEVVHKLDEKYLPKVGGVTMLYAGGFYLFHDAGVTTQVSNTELQEIVKSGFFCVKDFDGLVHYPSCVDFSGDYAKVRLPEANNDKNNWHYTREYVTAPV